MKLMQVIQLGFAIWGTIFVMVALFALLCRAQGRD